jgi:two-component system NtrC family sensor kinase
VYVVNREGVYQTPPAEGDVLGTSSVPPPSPYQGVRDERVAGAAGATRRVMTWVNAGRWLLVVQQPEAAIVAPVRRALIVGGLITLLALMLVLLAVAVVTSRLTRRLEDADRRLEAMYSDLLRSAKLASLGELATGLAHEINNPLATLTAEHTNVADVLEESDLPAAVRSAVATSLERCRRQVARCGRITARMLQFGRQSGTVLRPASLGPLVGEIGDMLGRRVRAAGATLRAAVEPDLPPVWLDPDELEQVLVNLVNNAMDAVSAGGTITISAARDGDALQLAVSDDGCGMPPRDLARVFQPFFTTKPAGRGTGLGLSVVYGIVQGWGATVSAESAVGKGTTMTIRLRRADGETEGRKDGETEGRKDGRTERQRVGRAERWTEGQDNGRSRWWKERSHD